MNVVVFIAVLSMQLVAACGPMKHYERVHKWMPVSEAFSQENGLLTPKMSLRRNQIVKVSYV
jgi:long-subunit acyl-CoA synthetase (AMP-forming)